MSSASASQWTIIFEAYFASGFSLHTSPSTKVIDTPSFLSPLDISNQLFLSFPSPSMLPANLTSFPSASLRIKVEFGLAFVF